MTDIKLFRLGSGGVVELGGEAMAMEKSLQNLMESNLDTLLGVSFLASEYRTGKTHGGRIDTLGIDENGSPVIIEHKPGDERERHKPGSLLPRLAPRP